MLASLYEYFYRRRKRQAETRRVHLHNVKVTSVGNITVGGTGKTPAVQWLVRRLIHDNLKVVIVGRGYGGEYSQRGAIVSDGNQVFFNAKQAGDEAILHARALPNTPVVIGRDRVAAAQLAVDTFSPEVIVLDDGFQYWSLARDFDLVLLDARRPWSNGKLLPEGRLREPPHEVVRAEAVLLTRVEVATNEEIAATRSQLPTLMPVFQSDHAPVSLRDEATGERLPLEVLSSQNVAAISALADNSAFLKSLETRGANVVSSLTRRDHHQWREDEVRAFAKNASAQGTHAIVTTEKDAVKMQSQWTAPLPLYSLMIELKVENEDELYNLIRGKIFHRTHDQNS